MVAPFARRSMAISWACLVPSRGVGLAAALGWAFAVALGLAPPLAVFARVGLCAAAGAASEPASMSAQAASVATNVVGCPSTGLRQTRSPLVILASIS